MSRRDMMTLVGASLSLAGLAACRRPVEQIVPYVTAPEDRSGHSALLRDDDAVPPERVWIDRREPRRPSDEGRRQFEASVHPWRIERRVQASVLGLYDPTVPIRHGKGAQKSWGDFVTAWGELAPHAADGGAGLASSRDSFSSPTLARLAADIAARIRESSGRPTTPSATRTASPACERPPDATWTLCSGSITPGHSRAGRRPAPHRPRGDPTRTRLRRRRRARVPPVG